MLGTLMNNPETLIPDAEEHLPDEAFYNARNHQIYLELLKFPDRAALDLITFSQHLTDRKLMARVGGPAEIARIYHSPSSASQYVNYRSILRDKLLLRKAIAAGENTIRSAHEMQDDMDKVADVIEANLVEVAAEIRNRKPRPTWEQKVDNVAADWTDRYLGKKLSCIPSPWKSYNQTLGGIKPGYHLILGLRKTGKSSLVGHKALHLSVIPKKEDRQKSIIFSYETQVETYIMRLASNLSGVRGECLLSPETHKPNSDERKRIATAMEAIASAPMEVVNATGMNVYDMEREARRFGAFYVGLDYLMLCGWLPDANTKEGTEGRIRSNSNAIINMSRSLNACVDVINHSVATGDRQGSSRWSDQPESDCDLCVNVDDQGITVRANRNGAAGQIMPIKFEGQYYRFFESPGKREADDNKIPWL